MTGVDYRADLGRAALFAVEPVLNGAVAASLHAEGPERDLSAYAADHEAAASAHHDAVTALGRLEPVASSLEASRLARAASRAHAVAAGLHRRLADMERQRQVRSGRDMEDGR